MEKQPAFHLAFMVNDLEESADFYCLCWVADGADAPIGWIDLHGHQLSLHKGKT